MGLLGIAIAGTASKLRMYIPMVKQFSAGGIAPVEVAPDDLSAAEVLTVAEYIRAHSSPNDYILQWSLYFHVGFLAERPSSTRFINYLVLNIISPNGSRFGAWLDEFSGDLKQKKPKFVVLSRNLVKDQDGQLQPVNPPSFVFQTVLNLLSSRYVKVHDGKALILFQVE